MIVMVWRRTSYTTKVLLTIKPLWPPDSPFLHSSPLVIPFNPRYLTSILRRSASERDDETDVDTI